MSKHTVVAFGVAGFIALLGTSAQTQTIVTRVKSALAAPTAVQLEQKAVALYSQPERALEAAQLQRQAAGLRAPDDPKGVGALIMSARLFNYAQKPLLARKTMEAAAERALAMGDVVRAAQAYVDAALIAQEQGSSKQVVRLAHKAVLLTTSPLLRTDERAGIMNRIHSSAQLAAAMK
jgi:hypothetical protein